MTPTASVHAWAMSCHAAAMPHMFLQPTTNQKNTAIAAAAIATATAAAGHTFDFSNLVMAYMTGHQLLTLHEAAQKVHCLPAFRLALRQALQPHLPLLSTAVLSCQSCSAAYSPLLAVKARSASRPCQPNQSSCPAACRKSGPRAGSGGATPCWPAIRCWPAVQLQTQS